MHDFNLVSAGSQECMVLWGAFWMLLDAALGLLWVFLDAPKGRLKFDRPKEGF